MVLVNHIVDRWGSTPTRWEHISNVAIEVLYWYKFCLFKRGSLLTYTAQLPFPVPISRICSGFFPTGALNSGFSRSESKTRASKCLGVLGVIIR